MTSQAMGDEQDPPAEQPRPGALEPALNPLQRLIQQRLRERGWSYREVARRGGLPHSTVHTLAATRNLARPPRPATIDALAKGLDVPVSAVRAAAAASTGLHYYDETPAGPENPGDPERELLIASIDELTPEDRRHVAALVESLRNRTEREPGGSLAPRARGGPSVRPAHPAGTPIPSAAPRARRAGQPAPHKDPPAAPAGPPARSPGDPHPAAEHADRAITLALRHDNPVIIGHDDRPADGHAQLPGQLPVEVFGQH